MSDTSLSKGSTFGLGGPIDQIDESKLTPEAMARLDNPEIRQQIEAALTTGDRAAAQRLAFGREMQTSTKHLRAFRPTSDQRHDLAAGAPQENDS